MVPIVPFEGGEKKGGGHNLSEMVKKPPEKNKRSRGVSKDKK